MLLKTIVSNSQYLTDETITDSVLVPIINGALSYINTEAMTDMPFVTTDNISTTSYDAITDSWQLRLLEPYLCFSIFSNDTTLPDADYHYKRFLSAVDSFIKRGLRGVKVGYEGKSDRYFEIDTTNQTVEGWFTPTEETIEDIWG